MLVGLTGTPGTGKTSVSKLLETRCGYRVIHLNELIKQEHLYSEVDEERDSVIADMKRVSERISELLDKDDAITILDSHLSHYLADTVIVLRASPGELRQRLSHRNYSPAKIQENVEAEALDVILIESVEWCDRVFEVNTTDRTIEKIVGDIEEIITALLTGLNGRKKKVLLKYKPGSFDWSDDVF